MWFEQLANSNHLSFQTGTYEGISGKAIFNTNGTRRYFLEKRWEQGGNILTAIMMNPSNAAHDQTDETVDQLINVARIKCGYHALYVVNVSSIIDGSSKNLTNGHFVYEPINWSFISGSISHANVVFLGWGLKGQRGMLKYQESNSELVNAFRNVSSKIYCYDVLKSVDKKFANNPLYYVPHPRPIPKKEKYRELPIRPITDQEFVQIFVR